MTKSYSDQELISAFRAGGQEREKAWEFAYKAWRDKIIGTIVSKNGTKAAAMDAMQAVVIPFEKRVIQEDFVLQHKLSTYFISCVIRQWIRGEKDEKHSALALEEHHIAGFTDSVEATIASRDLTRLLDETLALLGERCKAILQYFMNSYSMKEIAELMGFSGGEQVAKNEKKKCQNRFEDFLRANPQILAYIQQLRHG